MLHGLDPFVFLPGGDAFRASQILGVRVRRGDDPGVIIQVTLGVVLGEARICRHAYDMDSEQAAVIERDRILCDTCAAGGDREQRAGLPAE